MEDFKCFKYEISYIGWRSLQLHHFHTYWFFFSRASSNSLIKEDSEKKDKENEARLSMLSRLGHDLVNQFSYNFSSNELVKLLILPLKLSACNLIIFCLKIYIQLIQPFIKSQNIETKLVSNLKRVFKIAASTLGLQSVLLGGPNW